MNIKNEKGFTAIDIAIAIIIMTIFIALISNLIVNINLNSESIKRQTIATSYAIQEIEKIKAQGYINEYNDLGITQIEHLPNYNIDIFDDTNNFTGFHKTILIKDYIFIKNDNTKQKNLVKELTVEISYKLANKEQKVSISTYITND